MIVSLPMYDRPETAAAYDLFWSGIRDALGHGPQHLNREIGLFEAWEHPDLLLSQTCGLPYRARLHGKVALVGAPDFDLPGCPPGYYNSVLITHAGTEGDFAELAARRVVINQVHSQSGGASIHNHAADAGITLGEVTESGAHVHSARMVAEGRADLAAIDAHTWRMIRAYEPWAGDLREIGMTEPTPATPYITHPTRDAAALLAAMRQALEGLPEDARRVLGLRAIVDADPAAYLAVRTPKIAAVPA